MHMPFNREIPVTLPGCYTSVEVTYIGAEETAKEDKSVCSI